MRALLAGLLLCLASTLAARFVCEAGRLSGRS
jgi:hypothetical protein